MRLLHRYVGLELLRNFGVSLTVLTFVMSIGSVIKAIDYLARGASGLMLAMSFFYVMPFMFSFTIPIALIVSVLLLYNRLSLDGELTAMMTSGLSLWQISSPVVLVVLMLCGVSVFNNAFLAPWSHYAERKLFSTVELTNPMNLIEEGHWVRDFPGLVVYVGTKSGNHIEDVVLYEMDSQGVRKHVRAESGSLTLEEEGAVLVVELFNARITEPDPNDPDGEPRYITSTSYQDRIPVADVQRNKAVTKRTRDFSLPELVQAVRDIRDTYPNLSEGDLGKARQALLVEAHQRLTLAFSCVSFGLLGIGLGIRSKRKHSSGGIIISLGLIFVNYFFIILSQSLTGRPELHPELIQWLPVLVGQGAGMWLIHRLR